MQEAFFFALPTFRCRSPASGCDFLPLNYLATFRGGLQLLVSICRFGVARTNTTLTSRRRVVTPSRRTL